MFGILVVKTWARGVKDLPVGANFYCQTNNLKISQDKPMVGNGWTPNA